MNQPAPRWRSRQTDIMGATNTRSWSVRCCRGGVGRGAVIPQYQRCEIAGRLKPLKTTHPSPAPPRPASHPEHGAAMPPSEAGLAGRPCLVDRTQLPRTNNFFLGRVRGEGGWGGGRHAFNSRLLGLAGPCVLSDLMISCVDRTEQAAWRGVASTARRNVCGLGPGG